MFVARLRWRRWIPRRVLFCALILTPLTALSVLGPAALRADNRQAPFVPATDPDSRALRGPNQESLSKNWSGYVVKGRRYTSASGTWTVPAVSYAASPNLAPRQVSSTWVGIGGSDEQTLIQLGTHQEVALNGVATYFAWYELLPGFEIKIDPALYPVGPGDVMSASLTCTASCTPDATQSWRLRMSNRSRNWTWDETFSYRSSLASAEWIMEATTVGTTISVMPYYTDVTFSDVRANGDNPRLVAGNSVWMVDPQNNTVSRPTPPAGGDWFMVKYGNPPDPMLEITPSSSIVVEGVFGGPFTPASVTYQVRASSGRLDFEFINVPNWLDVSPRRGIATTTPTPVRLSVNAKANAIKIGEYPPLQFIINSSGPSSPRRTAQIIVHSKQDFSFSFLPPPSEFRWAQPSAISADGKVVVGCAPACYPEGTAVRWRDGKVARLNYLPNHNFSNAWGINADGSVVVGHSGYTKGRCHIGFVWREATQTMEPLPSPGEEYCTNAKAVSDDASVVVGSASPYAKGSAPVVWRNGVAARLPRIPDYAYVGEASSVDRTATVFVGTDSKTNYEGRALRWTGGGLNVYLLMPLPGDDYSRANRTSADGVVATGVSIKRAGSVRAVRWTGDVIETLGTLLPGPGDNSEPSGISGDGKVIVGISVDGPLAIAFRWVEGRGMQSIERLLANAGFDLPGWKIGSVAGISRDGTVLTGFAGNSDKGTASAWIARIPVSATKRSWSESGIDPGIDVDRAQPAVSDPAMAAPLKR